MFLHDWKCIEETNCWPKNPEAFVNPHAVFRRYENRQPSAVLVFAPSFTISVATDALIASVFGEAYLNSIETISRGHSSDQIHNLAKPFVSEYGLYCGELRTQPNGEVVCDRSDGVDALQAWADSPASTVGGPSFIADSDSRPDLGINFIRLMVTPSEAEEGLFSFHLAVYLRETVG